MRYLNCWDNKNFWGAKSGPLTHASSVKGIDWFFCDSNESKTWIFWIHPILCFFPIPDTYTKTLVLATMPILKDTGLFLLIFCNYYFLKKLSYKLLIYDIRFTIAYTIIITGNVIWPFCPLLHLTNGSLVGGEFAPVKK